MHELKKDVVTFASYEVVVKQLRERGPMTAARLGKVLGWSRVKVGSALHYGRTHKLIVPDANNRTFHGKRVYHAATVPGWPLPAPDTFADVVQP
jgi:hypothetical protein